MNFALKNVFIQTFLSTRVRNGISQYNLTSLLIIVDILHAFEFIRSSLFYHLKKKNKKMVQFFVLKENGSIDNRNFFKLEK